MSGATILWVIIMSIAVIIEMWAAVLPRSIRIDVAARVLSNIGVFSCPPISPYVCSAGYYLAPSIFTRLDLIGVLGYRNAVVPFGLSKRPPSPSSRRAHVGRRVTDSTSYFWTA